MIKVERGNNSKTLNKSFIDCCHMDKYRDHLHNKVLQIPKIPNVKRVPWVLLLQIYNESGPYRKNITF